MLATFDHPQPYGPLELVPYVVDERRRASAVVYRRRRVMALLVLVAVVVGLGIGLPRMVAPPGGATAPASGGVAVHVVQAGDTAWSVARAIQPEGDLRPLVDAVLAANGGSALLTVGQRLVVPAPG